MNDYEKIENIVFSAIEKANSIVIFGHRNPDGDCVGSVMGMKEAIKCLFPKKEVYALGTHPEYLPSFIEPSDDVSDEIIKNSLAVLLDLSDFDRVEDQRIKLAKSVVCIDHHVAQEEKDFPVLRDENAASATLIIARSLLFRYKKIPSKKCATYLFLGLVTDSGRFQFDCSEQTLQIASKLVSYGVDYKSIYNDLYKQSSIELKYRSLIYDTYIADGLISYCVIRKEQYHALNMKQEDASGKVNQLALIDSRPIWAFFTQQEDDTIRCELRSDGNYNVQKVALQFNGGGHLAASGCTLYSFDQIKDVVKALNEAEKVCGTEK